MVKRMMVLALLLAGAACMAAFAPVASAGENTQPDEGDTEEASCDANWPGCPCPHDLSELHIAPPEGMTLASGSCTLQSGSISQGSFTFTGNLTLKGMVVFYGDDMTEHLIFRTDTPRKPSGKYTPQQWQQFAGALRQLRINEWSDFYLPRLEGKTQCVEAPAVIRVTAIEALIGGTDEEGNWLRKYKVVKIGEFRECRQAMP